MKILRVLRAAALNRYLRPSSVHFCRELNALAFSQRAFSSATVSKPTLSSAPTSSDKKSNSVKPVKVPLHSTSINPSTARFHLTEDEHALIDAQRESLRGVLSAVQQVREALPRDLRLLKEEISRLGDGFFLLVVAGEYNSGKSSLINALAGKRVLREGPTPTTSQVTALKYAESSSISQRDDGVMVVGEPLPILKNRLQIVDTPGTNAIDRAHEAITRDFIPLCDIVLFVTSADRPFSESERLFLESIRQWGKKVVMVINKMDLLSGDRTLADEVLEFVTSASRSLLGSKPFVFPVSSRMALEAKCSATGAFGPHWEASGLEPLERYMENNLDSKERFRLKLDASASVGATICEKYITFLLASKKVVEADIHALEEMKSVLDRYESRVEKGFDAQYARLDNALLHMLDRADLFFDTNIRISNMPSLLQKQKVMKDFENEVIADTARIVQRHAESMAEWLSEKSSRNLSETTSIFARRLGARAAELRALSESERSFDPASAQPSVSTGLRSDTLRINWNDEAASTGATQGVGALSRAASELAGSDGALSDASRVADAVSGSVRTALTLEVGAVGLLGALLGTSALDVTGVASTGAIASAGLIVLPRRRVALRKEVRSRVGMLQTRLKADLKARVSEHVQANVARVRDAIAPFEGFTTKKSGEIDVLLMALRDAKSSIRKVDIRTVQQKSSA